MVRMEQSFYIWRGCLPSFQKHQTRIKFKPKCNPQMQDLRLSNTKTRSRLLSRPWMNHSLIGFFQRMLHNLYRLLFRTTTRDS